MRFHWGGCLLSIVLSVALTLLLNMCVRLF